MTDQQDAQPDAQRRIKVVKRDGRSELDAGKCQDIHDRQFNRRVTTNQVANEAVRIKRMSA